MEDIHHHAQIVLQGHIEIPMDVVVALHAHQVHIILIQGKVVVIIVLLVLLVLDMVGLAVLIVLLVSTNHILEDHLVSLVEQEHMPIQTT